MSELAAKQCVPCQGGVPPMGPDEIRRMLLLVPGWGVERDHHLVRTYTFPDFAQALAFVNKVGAVAEDQQHHPDLYLSWGMVRVEIWTHKVNGLTESDFILAAKIDQLRR